ncbi:MAG: ROK family protein [Phycisphaerales bacterium]|nr:ROK family protein [Phycisphaerales bacterium]
MNSLGIDIGGTSVKGVAWDGEVWKQAQSETYAHPERAEIVRAVRSVIEQLKADADQRKSAGVCLPGRSAGDSSCIELSVNLPALNGWAFGAMFDAFGIDPESTVCSDALAAGLDFVRTEQLGGRAACISLGTGVGLSVFDDGVPVGIGARGIGHLGMVSVGTGQTLEAVVGVRALRARFADAVHDGIGAMGDDDPVIRAIVQAVGVVHAIYVPRSVVLLGGVGLALRAQRDRLDGLIRAQHCPVADPDWVLRFGASAFHAAMGAARLANDPRS